MDEGFYAVTMEIDWEGPFEKYMYPNLAAAEAAFEAKQGEYAAAKANENNNAFVPDHLTLSGPYTWGENIVADKVVRTVRIR